MLVSAPPRTRRPETSRGRFARPCLEALEDRAVLSASAPSLSAGAAYLSDAAAFLTIAVDYGRGRDVTVHGALINTPNPGNQLISIMGMVNGQVSTDDQGNYALAAAPNDLGMVLAQKADGSSSIARTGLTDVAPVITALDAIEGAGGVWTIQGTVRYHRPFESLTVRIDGAPVSINLTQTAAGSTGDFAWAVQLNGTSSDNGSVWAEALSPWGLVSTRRYDDIHQTGT